MSEIEINYHDPVTLEPGSITFKFPVGLKSTTEHYVEFDGTDVTHITFSDGSTFTFKKFRDGKSDLKFVGLTAALPIDKIYSPHKVYQLVPIGQEENPDFLPP